MLVGLRPADSDVMRTQTYELSYWIDRMDEPWTTDEYINAGLTRTVAERWDRSGVYPPWAVDFEKAGIGPAEAWSWDVAPSLVLAYRAAGSRASARSSSASIAAGVSSGQWSG